MIFRNRLNTVLKGIAVTALSVVVMAAPLGSISYAAESNGSGILSKEAGMNGDRVVVYLDPGHDDKHTGARRDETWEEDLNLKIAWYCYQKLLEVPEIEVYMSRQGEDCPYPEAESAAGDNKSRVFDAQSKNADIYVALHLNVSKNATAQGAEVYTPNKSLSNLIYETGKTVAESILNNLEELGLQNRGPQPKNASNSNDTYEDGSIQDYYTVVNYSKRCGFPGIIVEHCFLDNPVDRDRFLNSEEGLRALGEADARGIIENIETLREFSRLIPYENITPIETPSSTPTEIPVEEIKVFDATYYRNNYSDVSGLYSASDTEGIRKHFDTVGKKEGRQASSTFDPKSYYNAYPDLRAAFGKNWEKYYDHFENSGKSEGRKQTVGITDMNGYQTVLDGVDYKDIYDYNYYIKNNKDLKKAFEYDDAQALLHFVVFGMAEGRNSSPNFEVRSYMNANRDLRLAFGKNYLLYFLHYEKNGKYENRISAGVKEVKGYPVVYDGVDYSAVYNYNFYLNKYKDMKTAFDDMEEEALAHFVTYGMREGRQGSADFRVQDYMNNYSELVAYYGKDYPLYYRHFIEIGKAEGRVGAGPIPEPVVPDYSQNSGTGSSGSSYVSPYKELLKDVSKLNLIMGPNGTSLSQMVSYYNSKATYPAFYYFSDAPTIQDFCRIVIEESEAEGVRPEIVFSQSMLETGFLQYGGQVSMNQYNFAGIGATEGEAGNFFQDVRTGIRVQVQHLKAYASTQPLVNPQIDPRFDLVKRGSAIYVEYLGIQENPNGGGWATAEGYGFNIMRVVEDLLGYQGSSSYYNYYQ